MDRTRLLRNAVFATVALTLACQPLFSLSAEAAPTDFGRKRLDVIAFGADNTGMSDSTGAIQAALNSCDATAGCEVYFPPGAYEVTQTTLGTPLLQTPSGVPITLAGAGQLASVIEAMPGAFPSVTSDVIAVGAGSTGLTVHDLGVSVFPLPPAGSGATGGAAFHLTNASSTNFTNITVTGGYDIFQFGDVSATSMVVQKSYVRSINSLSGNHCFMRLDGGVSDTYVRAIFAETNNAPGSQILCLPSYQSSGTLQFPGVSELHVADSSFQGFNRGFSFAAAQFNLSNVFLDNMYLDTAGAGPSFELFLPPGALSTISNIRVSNVTMVSSNTACVIHGSATAVRLNNVSCDGGAAAYSPNVPACGATKYPRGYALVEVSGTATAPGSAYVSITPPGLPTTTVSVPYTAPTPAAYLASEIGSAIALSTLVKPTIGCPILAAPQSFNDYNGAATVDYSIGPDIELYSYKWGTSLTPIISSGATTGTGIQVVVANGSRFAPGDGIYVGSPTGSGPRNVTVTSSFAEQSPSGVGLHLQGGSAMIFNDNHFGGAESANQYGAEIDLSGVTYGNVQLQGNNMTHAQTGPILFNPSIAALPVGTFAFSGNLGLDPFGAVTVTGMSCGVPFTNPLPFDTEVYISGMLGAVAKGSTQIYASSAAVQTLSVFLGIGESVTINCLTGMSLPNIQWFAQ